MVPFDEQIVFNQLDKSKTAIWSLLLAGGYLKAEEVEYRGMLLEPWLSLIHILDTITGLFNKNIMSLRNIMAEMNEMCIRDRCIAVCSTYRIVCSILWNCKQ